MKRILIAETNRKLAGALSVRFKGAGCDTRMVYEGARALAAAVKFRPNLLIVDYQMPGGFALNLRESLAGLKLQNLPFVFIEVPKQHNARKISHELGAIACFKKPLATKRLIKLVHDFFSTSADAVGAETNKKVSGLSVPKPRIVVLEDNREIASALQVRLIAAGYEVWLARNGAVALELVRRDKPDLLLSDVRMPMGFGLNIIDYLTEAGMPNLPVIFMTASKERGLRRSAEELGAAGFFEKPYDSDSLLAAIGAAVGSQRDHAVPCRIVER